MLGEQLTVGTIASTALQESPGLLALAVALSNRRALRRLSARR